MGRGGRAAEGRAEAGWVRMGSGREAAIEREFGRDGRSSCITWVQLQRRRGGRGGRAGVAALPWLSSLSRSVGRSVKSDGDALGIRHKGEVGAETATQWRPPLTRGGKKEGGYIQ